jgi:hypothetical protein
LGLGLGVGVGVGLGVGTIRARVRVRLKVSIVSLHRTTMCSTVCCGTGGQLRSRDEGKDKWIRKLEHGLMVQGVIFYIRYNNIQWK